MKQLTDEVFAQVLDALKAGLDAATDKAQRGQIDDAILAFRAAQPVQQAQPERAPLSEDAIVEMVTPESFPFIFKNVPLGEIFNFAKAVLTAAHGIKQGGQ